MTDVECAAFLQWALPRRGLRWPGFRRVRRQLCKRVARRMQALDLADIAAYRIYLDRHPDEWSVLDGMCRITISRFYRDRVVFDALGRDILPRLATAAVDAGSHRLRCWSAGCASGEEPYSLAILWQQALAARFPDLDFEIIATDADPHMLARARAACYRSGSLKELPVEWRDAAFGRRDGLWCLCAGLRDAVRLYRQDIRDRMPAGPFQLVLCRNLAFTYFDEAEQRRTLRRIARRLVPDGVLAAGARERLPADTGGFTPEPCAPGLYRRINGADVTGPPPEQYSR